MEYPFALSLIFLCLAVTLLAQAAITIFTYNKEKKARDLNFWWSCLILVVSIIGTIAAMVGVFMNRGSAMSAVSSDGGAVTGVPASTVLGTQLAAAKNLEHAQMEAAKVFGAK
jgi:curli biogenesis system outer membrane secretion channel CsgG